MKPGRAGEVCGQKGKLPWLTTGRRASPLRGVSEGLSVAFCISCLLLWNLKSQWLNAVTITYYLRDSVGVEFRSERAGELWLGAPQEGAVKTSAEAAVTGRTDWPAGSAPRRFTHTPGELRLAVGRRPWFAARCPPPQAWLLPQSKGPQRQHGSWSVSEVSPCVISIRAYGLHQLALVSVTGR